VKIFLNVIGILAMLAGPVALFLGTTMAAQLIGGIVLLLACTSFGLAKLIELGETHLERTSKHRALEKEFWKLAAIQGGTPTTPPLVNQPKWYVANGQEVTGPFAAPQIRELITKGIVGADTMFNAEGSKDWKSLAEARIA
jgi:hypothetical protein